MSFYERGPVRIHYEEAGSGFPLVLIAGGGLNSTISGLNRGPFDPIEEFKGRLVRAAQLRTHLHYSAASPGGYERDEAVNCRLQDNPLHEAQLCRQGPSA